MAVQFSLKNNQDIEKVSVIVPTSRGMVVWPTVKALLEQTTRFALEIILVCPDGEVIKSLGNDQVYVHDVGRLYSPGHMRNLGASIACGRYWFFIDDDCVPPPNWIEKECNCIEENERRGAVGCRIVSTGVGFWNRCADFALFAPTQYYTAGIRGLGAGAIAVRPTAFREVGGFDSSLFGSEDWDFCLRLRDAGWSCFFDPTVEVAHDHRRESIRAIVRSAFKSGVLSGLTVQRRHLEKMSWLARLAVYMGTPMRYLLMIAPYAFAVSLLNLVTFAPRHLMVFAYFPFVLLAQLSFHCGVFLNLLQNRITTCRS